MPLRSTSTLTALALVAVCSLPAAAQDSVAQTPGQSDAIDVYNLEVVYRYVVDSVPLTSSWGNAYRIAPLLKASADNDPLFSTQLLGSVAISPDQLTTVNFPAQPFSLWTTPGQGINELRNAVAPTINVSGYTRQFGVGLSDFASVATNAWGATVGQSDTNPNRFFVTRALAAASRIDAFSPNTATMTLGSIDASGNLFMRADNFGSSGPAVVGENILRTNIPARGNFTSTLSFDGLVNISDDPAATTYLLSAGTVTTNVPASIPASLGASTALILDFANAYRPNGGAGISTHLAPGIAGHRGNPSFSAVNTLGGVGTVASLARPTAGSRTNAINLFSVAASGAIVATRGATLPTNITNGQGFTANSNGNAEFLQYLSQTSFRGGSGQVGVGFDPRVNTYVAAATATDTNGTEYIALARFGASVTWTVAAFEGQQVLDGPSGVSVGTIRVGASPISISAPAVDRQGNVYFVAAFQPTVGAPGTALIRAVNTENGYRLERLLATGQSFAGANSGRTYTIDKLTLGDSDSIASGSFFSGNLLQPTYPNQGPADPLDPRSFGGAIVSASIIYSNNGVPETYQAVLFVGPELAAPPAFCDGDADGSGSVNFSDITSVLANLGATYTPPSAGPGDANNDGAVNFSDITIVLANLGANCV